MRDSDTDEQVLVLDEGEAASVGLFLDPQLLERLSRANPLEALHAGNLADYWTALEGVSHFLYLAWNAGHDRGVIVAGARAAGRDRQVREQLVAAARAGSGALPAELHRLLFERAAGRCAPRRRALRAVSRSESVCGALLPPARAPAHRRRPRARSSETLAELRRFYRLSRERKMRHIQRHS